MAAKMTPERRAELIASIRESERQYQEDRKATLEAIEELRRAVAMRRRRWWPLVWR